MQKNGVLLLLGFGLVPQLAAPLKEKGEYTNKIGRTVG